MLYFVFKVFSSLQALALTYKRCKCRVKKTIIVQSEYNKNEGKQANVQQIALLYKYDESVFCNQN